MFKQSASKWWKVTILVAVTGVPCMGAESSGSAGMDSPTAGPATNRVEAPAPAAGVANASEPTSPAQPTTANGIQDILRMADAGVSKEVIRVYAETGCFACVPTAADIVALKKHGVADEITVALVKRGGEFKAAKLQAAVDARRFANARVRVALDPESYDYFQRYYLYPRTLASVNDRLGLYRGYYFPRRHGSYRPYFSPWP